MPSHILSRVALRPTALALSLAIAYAAAPAHAAPAPAQQQASRSYNIPAGPLAAALTRYIGESGILLAVRADILQGKTSAGLQGSYSAESGLSVLLAGSGLEAARGASGEFVLRPQSAATGAGAAAQTMAAVTIVGARSPTTEGSGSYTAGALTLGKTNASLAETPHSVTIISRQQLEDQMLTDLNDVMRNTPGIEVFNTDSERVSFFARGQEITSVQFDGNAAITPGSGNGFYIQPDAAVLDHVEVLRGAAGLTRGAGSPSGAVNLVRKRPTGKLQASATLTGGTWDTARAVGDISGPLNEAGTVRGRAVVVKDDRKHFQQARYSDKAVLYGVLETDLGPNTVWSGGVEYSQLDTNGAWGNLLANVDGSPTDFPRDTYLGAAWNRWNRENRQAFTDIEHSFDNGWKVKASLYFINMKRRDGAEGYVQTLISRNAKDPAKINYQVSKCGEQDYTAEQTSWDVYGSGPFQLLGRTHELVIGANGSRDNAQPVAGSCTTLSGLPSMTGLDPFKWNPYTIPEPAMPAFTGKYIKNVTEQQGVYSTARFSVSDELTVIAGARVSWWDYKPDAVINAFSVDSEFTPYVAALYKLAPALTLYSSYADVFTPQRAFAVGGGMLKPITGRNVELGVKGEFHDRKLNTNLAVYQLEQNGKAIDDLDTPRPCLPDYPNGYCQTAEGEQRSRGVEAEVSGQLSPGWQMSAGYAFTTTKYLRDTAATNGNPLRTTTPKHLLRLYTSYKLPGQLQRWSVGGGVNLQSEISSKSATALARQGGYTIAALHAGYRYSPKLNVQLNVNNLLDKVYYEKVRESGPGYYYGPPRSIMLTVQGNY